MLTFCRAGNQRSSLWELRDEFTDATIVCQNGKFETKVHKIILASASPYFRDAFKISNVIHLSDVSNEEICSIVEYIYAGEITVNTNVSERFYDIARILSLKIAETSTEIQKSSPDQKKEENVMSLPTEILVKILSYVPTQDLLENVALVSKYFYQLTQSPTAHINVTLKDSVNRDRAAKFLKSKTLIRQLKMIRPLDFPIEAKHEPRMSRERDTKVDDSSEESDDDIRAYSNDHNNDDDGAGLIVLSIRNHPHLRVLEMDTTISYEAFKLLMKSKCWKNLTSIRFSIGCLGDDDCIIETNDIFYKGIDDLGSNVGLKRYSLDGEFFDYDVGCLHIQKIIRRHKNTLEDLSISYFYEDIDQSFKHCHSLKSIQVLNYFDDFEVLPSLTNLTTLLLGEICSVYSYEPGTLLANSLPRLTTLRIDTTDCENNQKPLLEAFADACPNLRILEFIDTHYRFANWMPTFMKIIKSCSKLEKLKCVLSGKGENLDLDKVEFNRYLPHLRYLHLDGLKFSFDESKRILRQCSSLEVFQCKGIAFIKENAKLSDIYSDPHFKFSTCKNDLEMICKIERMI